jgi:hypothetical protein
MKPFEKDLLEKFQTDEYNPKTLKDALRLSIAKWHPKNDRRGRGSCGLCEYYHHIVENHEENCELYQEKDDCTSFCPLTKKQNIKCCDDIESPYRQAFCLEIEEAADQMFKDLCELYDEEKNEN